MKQELLENLIRLCVRQVLESINEADDETHGASAPPADGQGTADQPPIPQDKSGTNSPETSGRETPEIPSSADLKGVVFINPRDKSKIKSAELKSINNDVALERELYGMAATVAGSKVKVALATTRMAKDTLKNPNSPTFLYLGKYDPNSDEVFLMADKSLQVAKDSSVTPADLTGAPVSQVAPSDFQASTATPSDMMQHMTQGGQTPVRGIDERLGKVIKKIVNEIITRKQ